MRVIYGSNQADDQTLSKHHFLLTYAIQPLQRLGHLGHVEAMQISVDGWQQHDQISRTLSGILELTGGSLEARRDQALTALAEPLREALRAHDASFDTTLHAVALVDQLGPPVVFQV